MKIRLFLQLSLFFTTLIYAQIGFQDHVIFDDTYSTDGAYTVYAVDIDGDGDLDVISASSEDSKVAWYENTNGQGVYGIQRIITINAISVRSIYVVDIDGDGDMDVLSASMGDNKIAWYENIDGLGTFGSQQIITSTASYAFSVFATDIDNDGDIDVLSASYHDDTIAWYENIDGQGSFGTLQIIDSNVNGASSVYAADLDSDGDMDVLSASLNDDIIYWYENTNSQGLFGAPQMITTNVDAVNTVYATDIDNDGDIDVLSSSASDDKIAWYENMDGLGTFGDQQIISSSAYVASSVYVADLDGDGDMDVLSSNYGINSITWYENINGLGDFGAQQVITTNAISANSVYAADLDGDNDIDVLSASFHDDKIAWYENIDGQGNFGIQQALTSSADGVSSVYSADLDGDGDFDAISTSSKDNKIAWYENKDGQGDFGIQQIITINAGSVNTVMAIDIDGDGDIDILSANNNDSEIVWYENTDGLGTFGMQRVVAINVHSIISVYSVDIDGDSDMDVLSASSTSDTIAWYENIDGLGTFVSPQIISTSVDVAYSVYSADIDSDGDMDVLSASWADDKIAWYENIDGQGTFGVQQIITTSTDGASSVFIADVDNDGDIDVLSASFIDNSIAWYENMDGQGTFGAQQIISTSATGARSVYSSDIDDDGDMDVLSASFSDDKIAWYENMDGQGTFSIQQIISTSADGASAVFVKDVNGDGNMDVLSASYNDDKIVWYENLGSLSVNEFTSNAFSLYPNPTNSSLSISGKVPFNNVVVYDINGRLLKDININNQQLEYQLNVEELSNGIYFLEIQSDEAKQIQKFIKK